MMNIYKILGVLMIGIMISGCTGGSTSQTYYPPVVIKGKYHQPYEVNLKGKEVRMVAGMTYRCQGLKKAKSATLVVKISKDKQILSTIAYIDNKKLGSGVYRLNKQGQHELYNKKTGKTEYLIGGMGKNKSLIIFTDNIKLKKREGVTFQCKLASDYKIKKYAVMSDQQVQRYLYKQKKSSYKSRVSMDELNEQVNQMNSSVQPIQYANTFGTSSSKRSYQSSSNTQYESASGNKYKYDLSNSSDRLQYSTDTHAQLYDSANPNVSMDRNMGQYGGGIQQ